MYEGIESRIESELEIKAYIQNLRYALDNGAQITFQVWRRIDSKKNKQYTNQYTINFLFHDDNPLDVIKREIRCLSVEEYIRTVKDIRFPNRSEMREFGRVYKGIYDVYIKIRVELLGSYGNHTVFVMSFHFAEKPFSAELFPYKK